MNPHIQRPRRFQFSLREILLATVAICAVVALFVKNRPHGPTDFLQAINERALVTQCCAEVGLTLEIGGASEGAGGQSSSGSYCNSDFMLRMPPTDLFRAQAMPVLYARLEQLLDVSGCDVTGNSKGGSKEFEELHEFSFRYRQAETRGVIRVYSFEQLEDQTRLMFLIDEW